MAFRPGTINKGGRPKGALNKTTREARDIALAFLRSIPVKDFRAIWEETRRKDPAAALRTIEHVLEYVLPKQARTEVTGLAGGPQIIEIVEQPYLPRRVDTRSEVGSIAHDLGEDD